MELVVVDVFATACANDDRKLGKGQGKPSCGTAAKHAMRLCANQIAEVVEPKDGVEGEDVLPKE